MQANSLNIGSKILGALHELKEKYKLLGDVRGKGLLLLHRITAGSTIEGVGE
jgi:4-aminobutyrate aminotransferase-like enzyme